jgi:hypothetical protein
VASVLAALIKAFVLHIATAVATPAAVLIGGIWGAVILDRALVISIARSGLPAARRRFDAN